MSAGGGRENRARVILLWSARYGSENGQAIVTRRVVECQTDVRWIKVLYETGGGISIMTAAANAIRALGLSLLCRPDVVYAVCSRSTAGFCRDLPVLLTALLGLRVVVHVHGSDLLELFQRAGVGLFARSIYRRCEILVPSAHLVSSLQTLGFEKVTLCENFRSDANGPITTPTYEGGSIKLLWNSNIMASKGIRECLEGARVARSKGSKVQMTILGGEIADEEASASDMEEFARTLSSEHWVTLIGKVPRDKAHEMVQQHDAVMLPSRYSSECQPLAIIEAMAAGREVLIRDTPALRTTAGNYPAIVVAGDATSIAEAIQALPENAAARAQAIRKGAAAARLRFAPERFDREMHAILMAAP